MAIGRLLAKNLAGSKKLARCPARTALLYVFGMLQTNVEGRFEADDDSLLTIVSRYGRAHGWGEEELAADRQHLHDVGLWIVYGEPGSELVQVVDFHRWNRTLPSREPTLPPPAGYDDLEERQKWNRPVSSKGDIYGESLTTCGTLPQRAVTHRASPRVTALREGKGSEEKGKGRERAGAAPSSEKRGTDGPSPRAESAPGARGDAQVPSGGSPPCPPDDRPATGPARSWGQPVDNLGTTSPGDNLGITPAAPVSPGAVLGIWRSIFEDDRGVVAPVAPADAHELRAALEMGTFRRWPDPAALRAEITRTIVGMESRGLDVTLRRVISHLGETWGERRRPSQKSSPADPPQFDAAAYRRKLGLEE